MKTNTPTLLKSQITTYDAFMSDLRPEILSWTALLGRWIEYAQASLALTDDDHGSLWKQSVVSIINLQAVTFALGELTQLASDDQPLAVDRADVLIKTARGELDSIWNEANHPNSLREIIDEAMSALATAQLIVNGWELVWPGPETMVMPIVDLPETAETLLVMMPGTIVMPSEPVAWGRCCEPLNIADCDVAGCDAPRQVYRLINDQGEIAGDYIALIADELPAGLPLLVPCIAGGEQLGHFTMEADIWLAKQRAAFGDNTMIPIEFAVASRENS